MTTTRELDRSFFGGNREKAIQRDKERCVRCGMTRAEHRIKYRQDITVDHIDGKGRNTPKELKNNNMDNLQTLCCRCHSAKDNKMNKLTDEQVIEIMKLRGVLSQRKIASLYGVNQSYVGFLLNGRWRKDITTSKEWSKQNGKSKT